jgi:hypothetical protein
MPVGGELLDEVAPVVVLVDTLVVDDGGDWLVERVVVRVLDVRVVGVRVLEVKVVGVRVLVERVVVVPSQGPVPRQDVYVLPGVGSVEGVEEWLLVVSGDFVGVLV